jgi:hypothetical protein
VTLNEPTPISSSNSGSGPAPWLRAGLIAGLALSVLDLISNFMPVIGFVITGPLNLIAYYLQGVLAARYAAADARFSARRRVSQAAISGLATGVVLAGVFTLISYGILLPATLGGAALALPFSLLNSLGDILFNVGFACLGAWLYGRLAKKQFVVASSALLGCSAVLACLVAVSGVVLLGVLGFGAFKDLIHLPFLTTPTHVP